jgi:hypothetical protein
MERRSNEADANDLSRLAWLYLHLHNPDMALEIVIRGLALEPENEHCIRLARRLGTGGILVTGGSGSPGSH